MRNSTRVFNSAGKKGRKRTEVGAPEDQVAPITASQKRPPEDELRIHLGLAILPLVDRMGMSIC